MRIAKIFGLVLLTSIAACDKDKDEEKNGSAIGAPQIKPPVERNTPQGFTAGLRFLTQGQETTAEERVISGVQNYLKAGPMNATSALERLAAIDSRMAELDNRAQTSPQRVCLLETAEAFALAAALPGSDTFPLSFQCQENLDSGSGGANEAQLAFGLTAADFYLMERTGSFDNAVLAKATVDSKITEFWQLGTGNSNSYIHLRAEDGVGMEFTAAGTGAITLDCGTHMKSNTAFVYIEGYDTVNSTCGTELIKACLSATTLAAAELSDCTTAKLDQFTLDTLTVAKVTAVDPASQTIIKTPIKGFIDFTKGVEEPQ